MRLHPAKCLCFRIVSLLVLLGVCCLPAASSEFPVVKVMTRNMDAGTDMNFILGATDQQSLVLGTAATLAEIQASGIPDRAARLAAEIAAQQPDLIAIQEATLWRTGKLMSPPATDVLFDQVDLLLKELAKQKLSYGVVAIQTMSDAEAPVPTANLDLRLTDRDVILARTDLAQSDLDLTNAQTHRYQSTFVFGSPLLGQLQVYRGWMIVDAKVRGMAFRFVNTHLESTYPGIPEGADVQTKQAAELVAAIPSDLPVILCGDFNSNMEEGPEHTMATIQTITRAGFADAWRAAHPGDPGYTWPLFGEDQNAGPTVPNERIDLIFTRALTPTFFSSGMNVVKAERIGVEMPWASDHAGLAVTVPAR